MNRNFHRIIFNAARGIRMVVQETAGSVGQGAGKATRGGTGAVLGVTAFAAALVSAPLQAQIVADPTAPGAQRATVLVAPNGVPLVNIQTPSAAGVSRNTYRQFDVNANGAILNNGRTNVQTRLGGYVQGNPWLATGSARVIVNEVNSSDPTYLRGFVEVAGPRSEVVIANPSGISVDGGSFINVDRATLTTGTPQYGAAGSLERYVVRGGTVAILGSGLDASTTDALSVLSRAFVLSGALHATGLTAVAGANQISADLTGITPIDGAGSAPAYAIDVARLGGMYANHIALVVDEAGVGARNAGTIQTSTGSYALAGAGRLTLSVNGVLENSGLVQTAADAIVQAVSLVNNGTVQSAAALQVSTQGDLANHIGSTGGTLEARQLELASAAGDIDNRAGTLRQTGAARLTVAAPNLRNTNGGFIGAEPVAVVSSGSGGSGSSSGSTETALGSGTTASGAGSTSGSTTTPAVASPGALTAAGSVRNDGGKIYAGGDIAVQTPNIDNDGGALHVANLVVGGPAFSNAGGTLEVANTFTANVGTLNNAGGFLHAGTIAITTTGDLANRGGTLASDGAAYLTVGGALYNAHGMASTVGALNATVAGVLDNTAGKLLGNAAVTASAGSLNNAQGAIQSAQGLTSLDVAGLLANDKGSFGAATDLSIQAGSLSSTGTLRAERDSTLTVTNAFSNDGSVVSGRNTTVMAGSLVGGATGVLGAGIQVDGTLESAGDLTLSTTGALQAAGTVLAAGDVRAKGTSTDLSGSRTTGAAIALTATAGDVTTRRATVATPGTLSVTANAAAGQSLVNDAGTLSAGRLDLHAANLRNMAAGQIVQTGTGATTIAVAGTLDNTRGTLASNGQDLTLTAATLINTDGTLQHAGSGTLGLDADNFSGARGRIVSNGDLIAKARAFDQSGGSTSARRITVDAGSLSNAGGTLVQTGTGATRIAASGALNNDGGTLASNGVDVALSAGTFLNTGGTVQHAGTGTLDIGAVQSFSGANGQIASNGLLNAHGGDFDLDGGTTRAAQLAVDAASLSDKAGSIVQTGTGTMRIATAGDLVNDGGAVATNATDVDLRAGGMLSNAAGHLQHAGNGTLAIVAGTYSGARGELVTNGALAARVAGAFDQDGGTTSARRITLDAGSLHNVAGTLAQTGSATTHIAVATRLDNSAGTIASNGTDLSISANAVSNANGHLRHAGTGTLAITATTFSGAGGTLTGNGALNVQAGTFSQDGGSTAARQVAIDATDIRNVGGSIVQSGTGATRIAATGALTNDGGTVASNGADLSLLAGGTLSNADGKLQHAGTGTLNLAAGNYSGAGGEITTDHALDARVAGAFEQDGGSTSARQLAIRAGSLSNRAGQIVQTGTGASMVAVASALDNTHGAIASNGDLTVTSASLANQHGNVRSAGSASLDLTTTDLLDNSNSGVIGAGGNVALHAASLVNDAGVVTAAGSLGVTVAGATRNMGGMLASNGNTSFTAAALDNTGGTIAAVTGDLAITTAGTTTNTLGTLAATTTLDLQSGALTNDRGLIQSGGAMVIDTHGQALVNTNAAGHSSGRGGMASGATLAMNTGAVDNTAGFIGAKNTLTATTAGSFTNTAGGVVLGQADVAIATSGSAFDNRGGKTLAAGNLTLDAGSGTVSNAGALLRSGATTTVMAATVDNTATLGTDQGIEGRNVAISAARLANDSGAIRADANATITSAGTVSNANGLMSAGDTLAVLDPNRASPGTKTLALVNTGGTLAAGQRLQLEAATFSADGTLTSGQDIAIALAQDLVNNATVSADRNLTYATTGTLTNNGKLLAGNVLTVAGSDVENTATGEMRGDTTIVKASGTLTNRGLIDGRDTQVDAGAARNIGTGRIYGDHLSIAAGTVDNLAETVNGDAKAGTLSARERLDIGAQTLRNQDGALVFSGGDLYIGGALDANRQATGSASVLENKAATIEALNNVGITANTLSNLNGGVTWRMEQTTAQVVEFTPSGSTLQFKGSDVLIATLTASPNGVFGWTAVAGFAASAVSATAVSTRLLIPSPSYPLAKFATYYTHSPSLSNDSSYQMPTGIADEVVTVILPGAWYGAADPIWATFSIPAPVRDLPADNPARLDRGIAVGQTSNSLGQRLPHAVTQAEYDEAQAYYAAHAALDVATQAFVNIVYAGTDSRNPYSIAANAATPNGFYRDYTIWNYTATTDSPVLQTSSPGKILSGGDMTLTVGAGTSTNDMSQILAGRSLTVTGGTIANRPVEVLSTTTTVGGTASNSYVNNGSRRYDAIAYSPVIPPKTVTLAAARQEGNQNATSGKAPDAFTFTATGAGTSAAGAVDAGHRVNPIVEVPSAVGGTPGVTGGSASVANADSSPGVTGGTAGAASAGGVNSATGAKVDTGTAGHASTVGGVSAGASASASGMTQTSASTSQSLVVRTTAPDTGIPTASLFRTVPGSASHYIVETDPAFASYRNWLSSDYLLNALSYDPATVTKRLGDGFYEQRLIREQVAQLTGYRYLEGSKDDQDQYTALMNAGATFAKAYQLTPGIALSAAQMAQLTSDIVWLVEQTVTLADGSTQKVLVPQVYVRVRPGDIDGSGALLSADRLNITTDPGQGDLVNGGTIAGRTMVSITADNVQNLNGRITGGSVGIEARKDLNSIGGTIDAKNAVSLKAGRDITIASTTQTAVGAKSSATALDRVAGVYVTNLGGTLVASAGHDVNLVGAILSNVGAGGVTSIKAVNDINLGTVKTASSQDTTWNAKNFSRSSQNAEVGSTIVTNGTTVLNADRDMNLRQATIDAGTGLLSIHADRNVTLSAGQSTQTAEEARSSKKSGLLTSKTTTTQSTSDETLSHGISLSGGLVSITANGNITGEGVKISGTDGVLVHANGSLDLHEARDVRSESNSVSVKKSGFAGSVGGIPLPIGAGSRDDAKVSSNTAVASSITSQNGGVLLQGDGAALLQGVKVDAAEDVTIKGGAVSITAATNYDSSTSEQYTRGTKIGASLVHDLGKGIDAKNTDESERQASSLSRAELSGANVTITSTGADGKGGLLTMTGTTVNTPGALTFNADKLILGTQTTQTDTSNTSQGGDWAWQKAKGEGSSDQKTDYNQFNVGTLVTPVNSVQIGLGARDSVSALAQQPGMSWVNQIASDPKLTGKVDWTKVEEAHSQWDYKQQGLTPAAAAVVTLVVAYFTAGAASGIGATAGNAAAVSAGQGVALAGGGTFVSAGAGAAIFSVVGGAVTAGVAALAGQAAVAVINNKGDIGGALNDLGSSANVHGLLAAIATGGVLGGMNLNPTSLPTEGTGAQKFMNQLGQNLQSGAARAVIGTAINGGSLEGRLAATLKNAFLDTVAAQGANAIGTNLDPGSMANALAHALAGCAVGAARRNGDCGAGALGAGLGELAASLYDPTATNAQSDTVQFAAMMGGIAVALAGGSAADINLASQAAANTAANNWLATQQQAQMKKEMDAAKTAGDKLQVFGKWVLVSGRQDALTASGIGKGLVDAGISDVQGLAQFLANPVEGLRGLQQIIGSPEARQQLGDSAFAELDAKVARMQAAVAVGGDQNAEQLGRDLGGLIWQVGSVVMGAGAAAKGGVALASAAATIGTRTLESSALQFMRLDAGAIKGFKSAEEVNALMSAADGWSPAWQAGTSVAEVTVKPGTTVKMVISEANFYDIEAGNATKAFGGWATFDNVSGRCCITPAPNSCRARELGSLR
ncbi:MAG: filamentous hemagglutinin N-terminal domain-containing protein [Janthinobacterium lividum]